VRSARTSFLDELFACSRQGAVISLSDSFKQASPAYRQAGMV
jgi:hypothetical protein